MSKPPSDIPPPASSSPDVFSDAVSPGRRDFLKLTAAAGATLLGGCLNDDDDPQQELGATAASIAKFDHMVVVMFENRSFDGLLGDRYQATDPPPRNQTFNGLAGKEYRNPVPAYINDGNADVATRISPGTESIERLVAGRWIRGLVAIAEQAVERAVLEHDHDHVIELRDRCRGGAELLLRVVVVEAATQQRRTSRSGQLQKVAPAGGDSIRENVGTARSGRGNVGRRLAHCHSASLAYLVARRLENLARSMTTRSCVPRPISSSPSIART